MSFYTPFAFIKSAAVSVVTDSNALAYVNAVISAGGTLSTSQQTAINNLYLGLKSNSLYTELKYMYPFMGGTPASHAVCGINPTNSSYNITWSENLSGSAAHTSAGVNTQALGLGYGTLGIAVNSIHSSINDIAIGAYTSTTTTGDQAFVIGTKVFTAGSDRYQLLIPFDSNIVYIGIGRAIFATYNNGAAPNGFWIGSRVSSTDMKIYKNGTQVGSQTGTNSPASLSTTAPQFFATGDNSVNNGFSGVCGFIFGGNGFSGTEASNMSSVVSTFLTAIGR